MRSRATRRLRSPLLERLGWWPLGLGSSEMSRPPKSVAPQSSNVLVHELHWAPLAIPLALAMIFAMAGLVCFWLDLLT